MSPQSTANDKLGWFDKWSIVRLSVMLAFFSYALNNKWDVTMTNTLLFHPERAHYTNQDFANASSHPLFEHWYYKIASKHIQLAVIPGAYHSPNHKGDYAFIMYVTPDFCYEYRYSMDQYITAHGDNHTEQQFYIEIGPNNFSRNTLSLHLEPQYIHSIQPITYTNISQVLQLELQFVDQDSGFPISLFQLGAMGFFGWIPFLECYHGVLTMNALVHGTIHWGNDAVYAYSANDDKQVVAHGYLDTHWGTNVPETWIWIQANHFEKDENVSLTLSLSSVPLLGDSMYTMPGFVSGLYLDQEMYRMSKWTGAIVKTLDIEDDDEFRTISIEIVNVWKTQRLQVVAVLPNAYNMKKEDAMNKYPHLMMPQADGYRMPMVMHWMNVTVWIRFVDDTKRILFEGESYPATVECQGNDNMLYIVNHFGQ
eukprot:740153_1